MIVMTKKKKHEDKNKTLDSNKFWNKTRKIILYRNASLFNKRLYTQLLS